MHKPEYGQVFGQWAGPGQQGLEYSVGNSGGHRLRNQTVKCRASWPAGDGGEDGCHAHPQFSVVPRSREPPEEVIVVPARQP
jgi:hypothetical protein